MSHSADPHLPSSRATNGFLALCTTYALFALYLLWALLPSRITTSHPFLTWLPNQAWTTVIPSFLMVAVLATYGSYLGLMLYHTPPLDSLTLLIDERSVVPPRHPATLASANTQTTAAAASSLYPEAVFQRMQDGPYDVPIGVINQRMFPARRRRA